MTVATTTLPPELLTALHRLTGDEKHQPAAYSTLDVLWVLYDRVLRVDPNRPDEPGRDRFLLSKGHGPAAFYAVLATKGFFPAEWLDDFAGPDSRLGHHPDRLLVPGTEISSGSLGHGLALGVGTALGLRAQGRTEPRVYVLIGDAELDEGSNHEAIAYAGATGLDNLTAIVIDNRSATHGWPGGIASRFTVNGWAGTTVDGRDHDQIAAALSTRTTPRPLAIVVAVGPMLDPVLEATAGLDVTVAYTHTPRPFDAPGLRGITGDGDSVVLVEPYLAGTSARPVADALVDVPHRLLSLGVGRTDLRRYGSPADHERWHGLDPATLRERISGFVAR